MTRLVDQDYQYAIELTNPASLSLTFQLEQAPAGMAFSDPQTGLLTWRPAALSNDDVAIVVRDTATGAEVARQEFRISAIKPYKLNEPPVIQTDALPGPAVRDVLYQTRVKAFDANRDRLTYTLDAASLARGIEIDGYTGLLQWLPTAAGSFQIDVTVADEQFSATRTYSLAVLKNAPPEITSTPPTQVHINTAYSYTLEARDPNQGDTLSYAATELPAWPTNRR